MRTSMILALGVVLVFVSAAWAGAPTEQLRAYSDEVVKVLENPGLSLPQRREAIRQLAAEVFDVSETARRALGQQRRPWDGAPLEGPGSLGLLAPHPSPFQRAGKAGGQFLHRSVQWDVPA